VDENEAVSDRLIQSLQWHVLYKGPKSHVIFTMYHMIKCFFKKNLYSIFKLDVYICHVGIVM